MISPYDLEHFLQFEMLQSQLLDYFQKKKNLSIYRFTSYYIVDVWIA